MSEEVENVLRNIQGMYAEIGSQLDALGGVHRCKACGHETPHQAGDGADFTAHGWPRHCGKQTVWVTQKLLDQERADRKEAGDE